MSKVTVFFENSSIHICYSGKRIGISDETLFHVLDLFWNHPSIEMVFLIKKNEEGAVLSKMKVMDKARDERPSIFFTKDKNGRK